MYDFLFEDGYDGYVPLTSYPWIPDNDFLPEPFPRKFIEDKDGYMVLEPPIRQVSVIPLTKEDAPNTVNEYFGGDPYSAPLQYGKLNACLYYKKHVEHEPKWLLQESFDWLIMHKIPYEYWDVVRVYREEIIHSLKDPIFPVDSITDEDELADYFETIYVDSFNDLFSILSLNEELMMYIDQDLVCLIIALLVTRPDISDLDLAREIVDAYVYATAIPLYDYDVFAACIHDNRDAINSIAGINF